MTRDLCDFLERLIHRRQAIHRMSAAGLGLMLDPALNLFGKNSPRRRILFFTKSSGYEHSSIKRNGNLYPTHGLGPVSQCMDINRGDRFAYLVSMSTPSRGLNLQRRPASAPGGWRRYGCCGGLPARHRRHGMPGGRSNPESNAHFANSPLLRNQFASSAGHSPRVGSAKSRPTPWGPFSKMCSSAGTPALCSAR